MDGPPAETWRGPPRSHLLPRTRSGWIAVVSFVCLMALAQWPFVFRLADRVEPWILGVPFLYAYLFFVYVALIVVLVWIWKRKL